MNIVLLFPEFNVSLMKTFFLLMSIVGVLILGRHQIIRGSLLTPPTLCLNRPKIYGVIINAKDNALLIVSWSYSYSFMKLVILIRDLLTLISFRKCDLITRLSILIALEVPQNRVNRMLFGGRIVGFQLLIAIAIGFLDYTQFVIKLVIHLLYIHKVLLFHICLF